MPPDLTNDHSDHFRLVEAGKRIVADAVALVSAGRIGDAKALLAEAREPLLVAAAADRSAAVQLVGECLLLQEGRLLGDLLCRAFAPDVFEVAFAPEAHADLSLMRCTIEAAGKIRFVVPAQWDILLIARTSSGVPAMPAYWGISPAENRVYAVAVSQRWLLMAPLILRYARSGRVAGSFQLNLGDAGHVPGIAFCANYDDVFLIPDPQFLESGGHAEHRRHFETNPIPWDRRYPTALWRGSTAGYHHGKSIRETPRVKLCLFAHCPPAREYVDAGVTAFVTRGPDEIAELSPLGILKDFIPAARFNEWRYHIDIDGNASSWSGLFLKLLSGGVVLKVASDKMYRQWYYDRLVPFENFVPVAEDFSDLISRIQWLRQNDGAAQAIAAAGRALACALQLETETDCAIDLFEAAILAEQERPPERKNFYFWSPGA